MNISDYFFVDETSPSGLRWKVTHNSKSKAGSVAGSINHIHRSSYWTVTICGKRKYIHRIVYEIATGERIPTSMFIDHIDHNGLNNKIDNLRVVSVAVNSRNQRKRISEKLGLSLPTGVTFSRRDNVYRAEVRDLYGKQCAKYFSIKKLGNEEALRLSVAWREESINKLNLQGAGYTPEHGANKLIQEL